MGMKTKKRMSGCKNRSVITGPAGLPLRGLPDKTGRRYSRVPEKQPEDAACKDQSLGAEKDPSASPEPGAVGEQFSGDDEQDEQVDEMDQTINKALERRQR